MSKSSRRVFCLVGLVVLAMAHPLHAGDPKSDATNHWAFKPPVHPPEPKVKSKNWPRNSLDRFVLARLETEKLTPSPEANRATLIRRLSFDLLGLPPAPKEVEEFIADQNPDAYEKLVERFLASQHYGERWGRHWLDVAGYADSNGYFDADSDRPLAYKYRDYVVRAFDHDKPFDQFIREQIAGDELAGFFSEADVTPEITELLTATHFLRNAPDGTGESDGNEQELRADRYAVLEGTVQIIGSALLGLTVQCARCHDHKFEPVTQQEYYGLQAILRPAYDLDHWRKPNERTIGIGTRAAREQSRRAIEQFDRELRALKESQEGLIKPFRALALKENLEKLPEATRAEIQKALDTKEKERTEKIKALLKTHEALVQIKDEEVVKRFPEIAASYDSLKNALKKREAEKPAALPQLAMLWEPTNQPPSHHLLTRGNYTKPARAVEATALAALTTAKNAFQVAANKTSGRRTALATWLTSPENPTLARLIVNRIWQHHFGVGLVATSDNFGVTGAKPSHPELLDWLSTEFVNSGWSVKSIHRLIVNSATYRQASASREADFKADPDDRLLWRFPIQRLDAEAIRDAMLCLSGEIDLTVGGPYVATDKTEEGQYVVNEKSNPGYQRRSLYLQQKRTKPLTLLNVFDGASTNPNCTRRNPSTVTPQSLAMLNSEFARARSREFAKRLAKESGMETRNRIETAFALAYGRPPQPAERNAAEEFLKAQETEYNSKPNSEENIWSDFCQMLLASNAFLYLD